MARPHAPHGARGELPPRALTGVRWQVDLVGISGWCNFQSAGAGARWAKIANEQTEQGVVARQTPVTVGQVSGEDYVIRGGLAAGDQVIVSNVQKLGDGAPVQPS